MPITLDGTLGITTPSYGGADAAEYLVPVTSFKNRIINGAMVIDQRNAGASVTINNTGAFQYVVDRFYGYGNVASKFSLQQNAGSVTPPSGFVNYLGATSLSAYSSSATDFIAMGQEIEGTNVADLGWGTANAKAVTLSFLVRSSLTGTFGGAIVNNAQDRSYPFSYTISSANTWEQKSITIAGDTTGTWLTNIAIGIRVRFNIGCGSNFAGTAGAWANGNLASATGAVNVTATNGATFYITGVQLEVGSTATSFDYRPYGTELALCQRYFHISNQSSPTGAGIGAQCVYATASDRGYDVCGFKVTMRASPTMSVYQNGTANRMRNYSSGAQITVNTTFIGLNPNGYSYLYDGTAPYTSGIVYDYDYQASAEL